mmetsp:Transcript_29361/g.77122  ORF Transcript_29361/g.77122 Transcript_29361/m.77122 type:complete len:116 (-) Transcript_29361:29-376(-)
MRDPRGPSSSVPLFSEAGNSVRVPQRVIGALHCSLRGAQLLVKHGQEAANRANLLPQHLKLAEGSPTFTAVVGAVAAVGFINQVATSFSLPAPLALFLLPLSLVEWTLTLFVGWV